MKTGVTASTIVSVMIVMSFCYESALAQSQYPHYPALNQLAPPTTSDFHAGLHSGSWTIQRNNLLGDEQQDPYRSCADPYCNRCAKHLADYGHEYQYLGGPNQRQPWYRGTAGGVAVTTQRGYDQHGIPYARRGQPAAIMSWEYRQTLNHAIWEQINAKNWVALKDAAEVRVPMLEKLLADASEQLRLTKDAFEKFQAEGGHCIQEDKIAAAQNPSACDPCSKVKPQTQFNEEVQAGKYAVAADGLCPFCLAQARYYFDCSYVNEVISELAFAKEDLIYKTVMAREAVRVAGLSKKDADVATRFVRIQNKPPKTREAEANEEFKRMIFAERNAYNAKHTTTATAPTEPVSEELKEKPQTEDDRVSDE